MPSNPPNKAHGFDMEISKSLKKNLVLLSQILATPLSFNECCTLEKVKTNYKNRHDWVTKGLKCWCHALYLSDK